MELDPIMLSPSIFRDLLWGRTPAFDAALYGLRNTVERGFNRLKQWRGVATRYALTYLGGV